MPPEPRLVPRFAAEPPQELLPYGRWAARLQAELLGACLRIDGGEQGEIGEVGEIAWYPDRSWHGRTYVPATATTSAGLRSSATSASCARGRRSDRLPRHRRRHRRDRRGQPRLAIDLCDEVIGSWRGEDGKVAAMTLVWGRPLVAGARDRHGRAVRPVRRPVRPAGRPLHADRAGRLQGDTLEVLAFDKRGNELARESLYAEDEDESRRRGAQALPHGPEHELRRPSPALPHAGRARSPHAG